MAKQKIIKICDYLIEIGILAIIFLVPIYFAFIYRDYSVFSLDKVIIFRILVEILTVLCLVKLLANQKLLICIKKQYLFIVLPFFVAAIVATLFSINAHNSFYGSYWRQQGLFTYFHYFLFFIIAVINIDKKEKIERIINVILLSSFFVSVLGIMQWLGLDNLPWHKKVPIGGRITSTMGQPVFLGNYLVLIIFLTVYKIIINKQFLKKFFLIILFVLQFLCLIFTYTRGAWLAFIFGALLSVFLYFLLIKKEKITKIIIKLTAAVLVIIFIIFAAININPNCDFSKFFNSRIKSITDFSAGSLAIRIKYWNVSLDAISKSPIIGYGLENQQQILAGYYEPSWAIYEKINSTPDRAHNELLELLLTGGVLLACSYLFIIIFVFIKGINIIKNLDEKNRLLCFFIFTSFFSYQFALLSSFSVIETNVYFWLYLAIILIIFNGYKRENLINLIKIKKIYYPIIWFIFILCSISAIYLIVFYNINSVRADYYFRKARISFSKNDYSSMLNNYVTALNLNGREEYYKWFFVNDLLESLDKIKSEDYRKAALEYTQNNLMQNRVYNNYSGTIKRAKILTMMGEYIDRKYFIEAEKEYYNLIQISPYMPETYRSLGLMYVYMEDYERALRTYNTALFVLPDLNNKYLNQEHRDGINQYLVEVYQDMAFCYSKLNDVENQREYYKKIINLDPYRLDIYKSIANTYYQQGDFDQAIWHNQRGYMLNPKDWTWLFDIALLYKEQGNEEEALKYAGKALKLAPDNNRIKGLIQEIGK